MQEEDRRPTGNGERSKEEMEGPFRKHIFHPKGSDNKMLTTKIESLHEQAVLSLNITCLPLVPLGSGIMETPHSHI